jgi:N6-adenosine-specific RNA methylase IME4
MLGLAVGLETVQCSEASNYSFFADELTVMRKVIRDHGFSFTISASWAGVTRSGPEVSVGGRFWFAAGFGDVGMEGVGVAGLRKRLAGGVT